MVSAYLLPDTPAVPLQRPHQELRRAPPEPSQHKSRIRRIAANLPRPTPLQQKVGRAMDQAAYLRTRQALIARESRGYDALRNPGGKWQMLTSMQNEILQTLGEVGGGRLPIERGLY